MLLQACVEDLKAGAVSREAGYVVVAMRQYPRGLVKDLRDEYLRELSPEAKLFKEFLALKRKLKGDHNYAFHTVGYERLFGLTPEGIEHLRRLAELSRAKDVYLICQCHEDQRCHRELLLLLARKWWQAKTEPLRFEYPVFEARIRPGERLAP